MIDSTFDPFGRDYRSQFYHTFSGIAVQLITGASVATGINAAGTSSFSLTLNDSSVSSEDPSLPRTSRRLAAVWLAKRRRA